MLLSHVQLYSCSWPFEVLQIYKGLNSSGYDLCSYQTGGKSPLRSLRFTVHIASEIEACHKQPDSTDSTDATESLTLEKPKGRQKRGVKMAASDLGCATRVKSDKKPSLAYSIY